ncbi:sigma 54 modulation/S30EA ribosomal C-terminal domain-containing protein [Kitasatospora sp. NPDC002227]|uniref:sigma 54 modulation/S30EA ribosomal C-terminal domain-containing protein n=1 Tax=Kitasatospora sp. NPDC002227 TaxID=3154773 RepID=UPI0033299318
MNRLQNRTATEIVVETRGEVSSAAPEYARGKLLAVLERLDEPVLAARVKLTQEANHAVAKPSLAQATVDLNGRPVRAHVAAATMQEAVDLLQDRLTARLARARDRRHGERRHSDEHRPQRLVRSAEARRIVRHKSYSLARQSAEAAASELEAMDYDFHLFTDAETGREAVVYRARETGGHRYAVAGPTAGGRGVPELDVTDAVASLDLSGLAFVFFTDRATGRGNVLYHRYDGHYGLITPVQ